MIFVDTSFLIAIALTRDALHHRSVAWSASLRQPLLTTDFVLIEFINFLSKPTDRKRAHAVLKWVQNRPLMRIVRASAELFDAGLQLHLARADQAWSLTDCISFQVMTERGIREALTNDHHFEQGGFDALLRRDPPS